MTLIFSPPASYGHDPYKCKKNLGQRSVGSEDRVKTDGRTDTTDRITFPAHDVGNRPKCWYRTGQPVSPPQSCPWVHFVWPDPTQPKSWVNPTDGHHTAGPPACRQLRTVAICYSHVSISLVIHGLWWTVSGQVKAPVVLTCTNGVSPNHLPVIMASDRPWTTLSTRAY